jgi:hypothetical protein
VLALVALSAGCGSGDSPGQAESDPIPEPGVLAEPSRPVIVDPLPDGWAVVEAERPEYLPTALHTLYLPPGSTPEQGPALAVGEFTYDNGELLCGVDATEIPGAGPLGRLGYLQRSGALLSVSRAVHDEMTSYVFGRDLTEEQMLTAARAALFPDAGNPEIPPAGLPPNFRRFAAAPVVPNGTYGEVIELRRAEDRKFVRISAYDGDAAADVLTRFWNATVVNQECSEWHDPKLHRLVDGTDVFLASNTSSDVLDGVAAGLTTTDQAGFDAFRAQVGNLSGAALLGGCEGEGPDAGVIVDGSDRGVRWALALSIGEFESYCYSFIIDGKIEPGGGGGSAGPMVSGPGTYGIEMLGGAGSDFGELAVALLGGTVPASATRVVMSDRSGATTEAELVTGGEDPSRQYFAGLLHTQRLGSGVTVVAYDKRGQEVGRFVSPV